MRVLPRLSRPCVTSESRPGWAGKGHVSAGCSTHRQRHSPQSDQGGRGWWVGMWGGEHGPLDQMEAAGFTAAFDLIRAHHSVKTEVRGQCGRFRHAYVSVRLT